MAEEDKKSVAETPAKREEDQQNVPLPEVMKNVPPQVIREFQSFMGMISSGPRMHPLFDKFTDEHIDKYLDGLQKERDHDFDLSKSNRMYYLVYAIIAIIAIGAAIVYLLPKDKDLLLLLIQILVVLAGGVGAGYGISKRSQK
jgi:hypothetical protein